MTKIRTRAYSSGEISAEGFPLGDVTSHLADPAQVVWIDMLAPSAADLGGLAHDLGLHELAVEDALGPHQRPKLDHYSTHMFMACHYVTLNPADATLEVLELDVFIGGRWLITVHKSDRFPIDRVEANWLHSPSLAGDGVAYLIYGLLDVIVDRYMDTVDAFDGYFDSIAEGIFAEKPIDPKDQKQWFMMGRALTRFHRVVPSVREIVSSLMRRDDDLLSDQVRPYYQDLYDHVLRVGESTESLRDLMSAIVETNLSLRDYRQNQIMKKVTSWAAIIAVPTLVTGIYGMNVPFPGVGNYWGVGISTVLIVVLSLTLYVLFKERDWL